MASLLQNVPEGPVTFDEKLIDNLLNRENFVKEELKKDAEKARETLESQDSSVDGEKRGFFSSFNVAQIWKEGSLPFLLLFSLLCFQKIIIFSSFLPFRNSGGEKGRWK